MKGGTCTGTLGLYGRFKNTIMKNRGCFALKATTPYTAAAAAAALGLHKERPVEAGMVRKSLAKQCSTMVVCMEVLQI